ncbi:MAG: OB-fold nucleic acid binding domain-containing protein [Candidatus Bathyarchaeia archaeon]
MGLEEIVQRILSSREDLTREEVLGMIEEKKRTAEGFFTDEAAARIVASELGVKVLREPFRPEAWIRDLVSGLNDVTVVGRAIAVYPPQTFTRPDGTEGKVARLLIADKSGTLKVVLWDDKIDLIKVRKVEPGRIIKVSHGYVREGLNGRLELHVGLRGDVQVSPPGTVESEYPPIAHFIQKIGKITRKHKKASVLGVVQNVYPASEFKRRDGTRGKVMRLDLRDDTGQITAVLWNEKVDELGDVKRGDHLRIVNGRVKERLDGRLELHVERATYIESPAEASLSLPALPTRFTKIKELSSTMPEVNVLARVMHAGEIREFRRSSGEIGRVSTLLIKDETGSIRLNLWEDKAALSKQIQPGDIVLAEGAYPRERFGKMNLNLGRRGVLTLNPRMAEAAGLPPYEEETMKIAEIEEEGDPINVEGTVATAPTIREVTTTRDERIAVASFDLTDDTGRIRVSIWRKLVDAVRDLPIGTRIKIKNAYVKKGFSDQLELTSRVSTSIETLSKPEKSPAGETSFIKNKLVQKH